MDVSPEETGPSVSTTLKKAKHVAHCILNFKVVTTVELDACVIILKILLLLITMIRHKKPDDSNPR